MTYRSLVTVIVSLSLFLASPLLFAQGTIPWHDPSPHTVHFVNVESNVRLEVLDWGGSGRAIVLLSGSGNTAHVYDDFAPKLNSEYHVYGITRRGFGLSSHPDSGYDDQRLADDVLEVLTSLKIAAPVLVGHSMAGSEMTTLGSQHPVRLAGLVYLDAADDPTDTCWNNPEYHALFTKLPTSVSNPAQASTVDKKSLQSFYDYWHKRTINFAFPESELRNMYEVNPDGSVGQNRTPNFVRKAISDGSKKQDYSRIRIPMLAFFASPPNSVDGWSEFYRFQPTTDEERAALEKIYATDRACSDHTKNTIRSENPNVRIVDLTGADHYVFFSNESDILRELRTFLVQMR